MPLFALAIPVLHSSGAWIAYAGSGYLAGTLSSSWVGAFILGNASLLSSLGLVSVAGVAGASGVLAGLGTGAALGAGKALTAVGLGGMASWLGIAPVATFLGLTPVGWAIAGGAIVGSGLLAFLSRRVMRQINEERAKGDLKPITALQIVKEVKEHETQSLCRMVERIADEVDEVEISADKTEATFEEGTFSLKRLRYVINADGSEEIVFVSRTGKRRTIFIVRPADVGPKLAGPKPA